MTPIGEVRPYENNPRKNEDAVSKVAASLREFGWQQPIVCDEKMVVIVGHTRLQAAEYLGMDTVPVHIAKDLSETQAAAYRIADNRTGEEAMWDPALLKDEIALLEDGGFDMELLGFEDDELGRLFDTSDWQSDAEAMNNIDAKDSTAKGKLTVLFNESDRDEVRQAIGETIETLTETLEGVELG